MNIFLREMKAGRKALVIWCLGMLFTVAAGMGKFAAFSTTGDAANELITSLPESLRVVMGFGDFDLTKAIGFFGVLFSYLTIMTAIHATVVGATVISKEERDKTAEFLMAKPVSRYRVIAAKLAAALVNVLVLNLATWGISLLMVSYYSGNGAYGGDVSRLMLGILAIQLIFMLIGSAIAGGWKRPKLAASAASGIMLAAYVLDKVIDLNEKLEFLRYLTPFKYYNAAKIIQGTGFEPLYVLLSVLIAAGCIYVTFIFYGKRDLKV